MIRKSEITLEPDDIDGRFGHRQITEKWLVCFQKDKSVTLDFYKLFLLEQSDYAPIKLNDALVFKFLQYARNYDPGCT